MENLLKAPPLNISSSPKRLPLRKSCSMTEAFTPGTGICVPALNTMNMARVNKTFCLSSVILNMFARAANTLITSILPPAATIFSSADLLKPIACTVSFLVNSPLPRIRMPSRMFLTTPSSISITGSTTVPSSKRLSTETLIYCRNRV